MLFVNYADKEINQKLPPWTNCFTFICAI